MSDVVTKETKHGTIIVDACDADLLERAFAFSGTRGRCFYARTFDSGKNKYNAMHRLILARAVERDLESREQVDHANGNGLDNRRDNLRIATQSQNNANKLLDKTNTSGFKGVYWFKRVSKWRAEIQVNRLKIHLGYFTDLADAHAAYVKAAKKYFGEFANDGNGGAE